MNQKITELAGRYKELREAADVAARAAKEAATECEMCEAELLDAFIEEGVNSVDIDGIGKLSMTTRDFMSVPASNQPAFFAWMKETGHGGLLKEYVNPQTLSAWMKERREEITRALEMQGENRFEAAKQAVALLENKGATVFQKRGIQFRKEKP